VPRRDFANASDRLHLLEKSSKIFRIIGRRRRSLLIKGMPSDLSQIDIFETESRSSYSVDERIAYRNLRVFYL
jgi:hypothetical protein